MNREVRNHQPSRLDQTDQSQISDSPWQLSLLGGSVKVNLRSGIGRFGLIVRVGGINGDLF